jgi:hypothetical protein
MALRMEKRSASRSDHAVVQNDQRHVGYRRQGELASRSRDVAGSATPVSGAAELSDASASHVLRRRQKRLLGRVGPKLSDIQAVGRAAAAVKTRHCLHELIA